MEFMDKASDLAQEAGDKISGAASKASDVLSEKGEQFKNAEQRLAESCCSHITEYPVMSTVMAVGLGFLVNRLLNTRQDNSFF